jgi:hypothetical protein
MEMTTKIPDYKNLQPGQRFYYTGDQANNSSFGEIVEQISATKYTQFSYKIKFEDGRESVIMHQSFSPSIGQRFKTIEQYNEERANKMEQLYKQFPNLKK